MSTDSNAKIFSVIGGCGRSGRWLVPEKTNMMTLFGRAVIDLRDARTNAEELEFTCLSVFANITFIVPEGAEIRPSGMAIFGSSRSTVPTSGAPCDLPPISIEATTVIGRLRIRTTEEVPDHDLSRRKRRRQSKTRGSVASTQTVADVPAIVEQPTSVASAPPAGIADAEPPRETGPEVATTPREAMTPKADLSRPITAFQPVPAEDRSPVHGVAVPPSIEGTMLDPDAASPDPSAAAANEASPVIEPADGDAPEAISAPIDEAAAGDGDSAQAAQDADLAAADV